MDLPIDVVACREDLLARPRGAVSLRVLPHRAGSRIRLEVLLGCLMQRQQERNPVTAPVESRATRKASGWRSIQWATIAAD